MCGWEWEADEGRSKPVPARRATAADGAAAEPATLPRAPEAAAEGCWAAPRWAAQTRPRHRTAIADRLKRPATRRRDVRFGITRPLILKRSGRCGGLVVRSLEAEGRRGLGGGVKRGVYVLQHLVVGRDLVDVGVRCGGVLVGVLLRSVLRGGVRQGGLLRCLLRGRGKEDEPALTGGGERDAHGQSEAGRRPADMAVPEGAMLSAEGDGEGGGAALAPGGGDAAEAGEGVGDGGDAAGAEGAGGEMGGGLGGEAANEVVIELVGGEMTGRGLGAGCRTGCRVWCGGGVEIRGGVHADTPTGWGRPVARVRREEEDLGGAAGWEAGGLAA